MDWASPPPSTCTLKCLFLPGAFRDTEKSPVVDSESRTCRQVRGEVQGGQEKEGKEMEVKKEEDLEWEGRKEKRKREEGNKTGEEGLGRELSEGKA